MERPKEASSRVLEFFNRTLFSTPAKKQQETEMGHNCDGKKQGTFQNMIIVSNN